MGKFEIGKYKAVVVEHGFGKTTGKETPYLKIEFKVVAQFDKDDDEWYEIEGDDAGQVRNVSLWMTEKCAQRTIDTVKGFGWAGTDLADLHGDCLVGEEIEVVCKGQTDEGYDDFDLPRGGGGAGVKKDDDVLRSLRQSYNGLLKPTSNGKPKDAPKKRRAKKAVSADTGDEDDGDIPF